MDEKANISLVDLKLMETHYKYKRGNEEKGHLTNINYSIKQDNIVEFEVTLSVNDKMFQIDSKFLLVVNVSDAEDIEKFIENNKEQIIHPTYVKMTQLVANLTDQTFILPQIVPPYIWINNKGEVSG